MALKVFFVLTIILHFIAAVIAVRLTKVTKYNLSWMLISAALVLMAVRRIIDALPIFTDYSRDDLFWFYSWAGVATSLCFAVGVFLIQKIFKHINKVEKDTRDYEKKVLNAVVQAEEAERKRFANEIHDGLGPILSSIKMGLSVVKPGEYDQAVIDNLQQAVHEAIATVREISNNLSPHVLSNFGLEKAINNFIYRLNLPDSISLHPDVQIASSRYESTVEIVVYRVFCELVNNTICHSGASNIVFSLYEEDSALRLDYSDDGVGFNPHKNIAENKAGSGYFNMISRVSSLKGSVDFGPGPNGGLIVKVIIPLK
jgi:signal transduction histidine kinase